MLRNRERVIEGQPGKEYAGSADGQLPGQRDVAGSGLQQSGHCDDHTVAEDIGEPVKRAADSDKGRLAALALGQHIEAVSRYVVCGGGEGREDKQDQREREKAHRRAAGRDGFR